jgi:putative addiction module component (TIGR02574 family)
VVKVWYSIFMTKLQSIVAEIEALPANERQELISMFAHLASTDEDIFKLSEAELAELDRRMMNIENEPTFSSEEVFATLREKYAQSDLA